MLLQRRSLSSLFSASSPQSAAAFLLLRDRQRDWMLTDAGMQESAELITADACLEECAGHDAVLFAYAKQLFKALPSKERRRKLVSLHVASSSSPLSIDEIATRNRMRMVLGCEINTAAAVCIGGEGFSSPAFAGFCAKRPEWNAANADSPTVNVFPHLCDRLHASSTTWCSMSAPMMLAHYVSRQQEEEANNLPVWLQQRATPTLLERLVWRRDGSKGRGVDSKRFFLRELCPTVPLEDFDLFKDGSDGEALRSRLIGNRGSVTPALVSRLRLPQAVAFEDEPVYLAAGDSLSSGPRMHSMLLVGCRYLEGEGARFLLQNWWRDKPFIEVDCAFLRQHGARVSFPVVDSLVPAPAPLCVPAAVELDLPEEEEEEE